MITKNEKKRRFFVLVLSGLVAGAVIVGISLYLFRTQHQPEKSSVKAAQTEAVKGGAGGPGTPAYNEKLEKYDDQQSNKALESGESYMSVPVGKGKPLIETKKDTPRPPTAPTTPAPAPVVHHTPPPKQVDDPMLRIMMDDLAAMNARLDAYAGAGSIVYNQEFPKNRTVAALNPDPAQGEEQTSQASGLRPGDLLYAVLDTGVNSDVPSAVMATVATGKYRNARLLGSFKRFEERLVLAFNRAILPDGNSLKIDAYAIDPDTTEASVASAVDTHFFSRWGGLVAAAFLEGLGEAKRYSGAQSIIGDNGGTDQMIWKNYSVQDQAWIAAGKVGSKASRIFERNFDRPPTVYMHSGAPIGILILDTK